ncbi:phenylalanine--tRNA ligase subunit alpha [Candidatus Woesearchaeota archaeon]|jgi:phenylalanyl-tRNA synthetase alpha chain|nr:phenylalanine--tRNA ligase subunit alpha [Candidatus Woesearchaeota archaeon]MBT6520382.1 phenylalanine--tRNA ligase subunit alpha [Candidatus Woesearchaeota archaeon]MBT7368713.1 phenylalanine--tRNA ligase subunit alpha [Candidatus Woesearchaeota archaeon]
MDTNNLIDSLHPLEIKVIPFLKENKTLKTLVNASGLSEVEVMRTLQWLSNKSVLNITADSKKFIELDENGKTYLEQGLPEKRFLITIKDSPLNMNDLIEKSGLNREEFNVCIGLLRKSGSIIIENQIFRITELGNKFLEKESLDELFLKKISENHIITEDLAPEEKFAFDNFSKRKNIIKIVEEKTKTIELTDIGNQLVNTNIISKTEKRIDRLTPEMLKNGDWKNKVFRRYDVKINVPKIYRGKRHFVNQALDYAKRVWLEMGFKEMKGPMLQSSFWNFDALFTAQDHPVRELQDTFFIKEPKISKEPPQEIAKRVKDVHEFGGDLNSLGWQYKWNPKAALQNVLRTHTTVLSAKTLAKLKKGDLPAKFFAVGKCFRNETLDFSHLFEFNQTEGIVIDPNANFKHLLGYLKAFAKKMGYEKIRFRPAYFPYTEPSVEGDVYDPVRKKWIEIIAAGIFRPEVVKPLLGVDIPVLAWGPGIDRMITGAYNIKDIRELYKNDLKQIRDMKEWMH